MTWFPPLQTRAEQAEEPETRVIICAYCERELDPDAQHCAHCKEVGDCHPQEGA